MARVDVPKPPDDAGLVDDLCELDNLTEWEVEFVESIAKRVRDGGRILTLRQREIATKIWRERSC